MKLLVGLGNPEKKYDGTYHNMGFFVLDKFAEKFNADFDKKKHNCKLAFLELQDDVLILAKPLTYMNLSGNAVLELKKKFGLKNTDILVVVDDIDLPVGTYRYKSGGSGGTHNGMRNIVSQIGTDFPRLRIGIGKPEDIPLIDFVLKKIPAQEKQIFEEVADEAIDVIAEKLGVQDV